MRTKQYAERHRLNIDSFMACHSLRSRGGEHEKVRGGEGGMMDGGERREERESWTSRERKQVSHGGET